MKRRFAALAAGVLCLSFAACGHAGQTYSEYVQAVMDCTYQGNTSAYRKLTKASESAAQELRQEEIAYLSSQLCHQATVDRSVLDAETAAGFDALAQSLIGKVKCSASDAVKAGELYQITITAEPLTIWDVTLPELESAYKDGFAKAFYSETPGTDSYNALEAAWGEKALEIYNAHLDEIGNGESKTLTTVLYADSEGHYTFSQDTWRRIDDLVYGISE